MSQPEPEILDGRPPTDEEKQLQSLFQSLQKEQLTYLDEANKRLIELCTGLLGVLFAALAFGKDFPPPYLAGGLAKATAVLTLLFFFLALMCALWGVQPRDYQAYAYNLEKMRQELQKMVTYKAKWFRWASWLFGAGSLALVLLIVSIVLG